MLVLAAVLASSVFGRYFVGNGTGMNFTLDLHPQGIYRYEWDGCFDQESVSGRFKIVDGEVRLASPLPKTRSMVEPPKVLIPIRWSPRIFLVEPSRLSEFCVRFRNGWRGADKWHEGRFLRNGSYPANDQPAPALNGHPEVPAPYSNLLDKAFSARVVRNADGYVESANTRTAGGRVVQTWRGFVTNVGSADGLSVHVELQAPSGRHAKVIRLGPHSSICGWTRQSTPRVIRKGKDVFVLSTDEAFSLPVGTPLTPVLD